MNCKEIIENYLRANGAEGLAGEDCGCGLDDLAPCCDGIPFDCVPAVKVMCDGKPEPDSEGEIDHECPGFEHELYRVKDPK